MTELDLHDLMHDSMSDIHAPDGLAANLVAVERRRHRRNRIASVTATGVTAGVTLGVVASIGTPGAARPVSPAVAAPGPTSTTGAPVPIRLTAAQTTLKRLASSAAAVTDSTGRYGVVSERRDGTTGRVSVIDGRTGDVTLLQPVGTAPAAIPDGRLHTLTDDQLAAIPTDAAGLRAYLVAAADQIQATANRQLAALGEPAETSTMTADDKVFSQASDLLWNPLVPAALRSALFGQLSATPGVSVASTADAIGRPAVKISRAETGSDAVVSTFEDPTTSAALETSYVYDDRLPASAPDNSTVDVFTAMSRTDTPPTHY